MYTPLLVLIHSLICSTRHGQLLPSSLTLLLFSYAQNHPQTGLLTQYHIFPQSSSKLKPITTTERLLAANMWSVKTADTD